MEHLFTQYIEDKQLFPTNARLLVAVSGGVDSMLLATLLAQKKYHIAVAHCNFNLRGQDAIDDAVFVKKHFENQGFTVHIADFDTAAYAKKHKLGTQEAARNLRYDFFQNIAQEFDYQYIATAHHLNDNVETMLFNLSHGTGIRGLKGIARKQNNIVRPLLFAKKNDILAYAKIHNIPFREDASNASDKYSRNAIRQHVIPALEQINPSFVKSADATLDFFQEQQHLFDFFMKNIEKKILTEENKFIKINISSLLEFPSTSTILFEILRHKAFSSVQCKEITRALQPRHSGKLWISKTHELLLDREYLIIRKKQIQIANNEYIINFENSELLFDNSKITLFKSDSIEKSNLIASNIAYLDVTKLSFPLILRRWQAGDFFLPLGLKGKKKKLQDYFSDLKLNRFEKEDIWILTSDSKIVWIIGFRQDERFAVAAPDLASLIITYEKTSI